MRGGVSGLLSQLPTRPCVHIRQQPQEERTSLPTWLDPTESASNAGERRVEVLLPHICVYAGFYGHRAVMTVHNGSRSGGGRSLARATLDVDQTVTKIDDYLHHDPGLPY